MIAPLCGDDNLPLVVLAPLVASRQLSAKAPLIDAQRSKQLAIDLLSVDELDLAFLDHEPYLIDVPACLLRVFLLRLKVKADCRTKAGQ